MKILELIYASTSESKLDLPCRTQKSATSPSNGRISNVYYCTPAYTHNFQEKGGIVKTVVSKTFLFTMDEMFTYYVKPSERENMKYIMETVDEKTWRSRKNGIEKK